MIGASARAAAQSALRAGYRPWCIDMFADRDLREAAPVRRVPAGTYPAGILKLLQDGDVPAEAPVLFTGAMENHLDIVQAIAMQRELLTSGVEAMRAVRDPEALASMPAFEHVHPCRAWRKASLGWRLSQRWLGGKFAGLRVIKPLRSAGGKRVRLWHRGARVTGDEYLQQYIQGQPIAAVYNSDGWSARLLGVTRQIIGDAALGAEGFEYSGSIGPIELSAPQRSGLSRLGVALAQRFDLRGVFGVDAVVNADGIIWPVEVNPRYTASVEVIERGGGVAALRSDPLSPGERAGVRGLPDEEGTRIAHVRSDMVGKAYVYARQDGVVPDLTTLFDSDTVADIPDAGSPVRAGQPICTLFAGGDSESAVLTALHDQARTLYTRMQS
ncbi:MAG: ATP-grasp domain-containing protein [Phycisphaeraceae bacterium]